MNHYPLRWKLLFAAVVAASAVAAAQQPAPQQPPAQPQSQQPTTVGVTLTGEGGAQTRLAVPDLLSLSNDRETTEAARVIGEVLWDDLNFEREFYMIPRDTYKSIPASRARSSPSRPTATVKPWSAPSRSATSRKST